MGNENDVAPVEESYDSRAHRTLNSIVQDGQQRLADIEQQVNRLFGERDAIQAVLQRIAPSLPSVSPPQKVIYTGTGQAVTARPNW
jgi:hypothetical protein